MSERFLTKDEELLCGERIQAMVKAKEQLLSDQEFSSAEKRKLQQIITEGNQALATLVKANTALVWSRANAFKRSYPSAPDIEDIAQDGMLGLMNAALRFDPKRGNKFSTVAYHWIRQAIVRNTNTTARTVRLPENRIADLIEMNRIRDELKDTDMTDIEIQQEIQKRLNLSDEYYTSIVNASNTTLSLNQKINTGEEEGRELLEHIGEINHEDSAEQDYLNNVMYETILQHISAMSTVEQDVITSYYRMDIGQKRHQLPKDVKAEYGLTNSRYNRILNNALKTIRKNMQETGLTMRDFS